MAFVIFIAATAISFFVTKTMRKLWRQKGHSDASIRAGTIGAGFGIFMIVIVAGINLFPSEALKQQRVQEAAVAEAKVKQAAADEAEAARLKDLSSDRSIDAFIFCKNEVKGQLKAPASADFPMLDRNTWAMKDQVYVVKSYVDAQNSFGAKLRTHWRCEAKYLGGGKMDSSSWQLISVSLDE